MCHYFLKQKANFDTPKKFFYPAWYILRGKFM